MKTLRVFASFLALAATTAPLVPRAATPGDALPWSQLAANSAIARWPDGRIAPAGAPSIWNYELGTLLEGIDSV